MGPWSTTPTPFLNGSLKKAGLDVMQSQPLCRTHSVIPHHCVHNYAFLIVRRIPRPSNRRPVDIFIYLFIYFKFSKSSQAGKEMLKRCAYTCTFVAFHSFITIYIFSFHLGHNFPVEKKERNLTRTQTWVSEFQ